MNPTQEVTMLVIYATKGDTSHGYCEGVGVIHKDYRGYSRGMGEFMLKVANEYTRDITEYDYVAILGDDIIVDHSELLVACSQAMSMGVRWFQPSMTPDSFYSFPATLHKNIGWRNLQFCELNCVYQTAFFLSVKHLFNESISGWGLDVLLGSVYSAQFDSKPQVCDHVQMRHTRPVRSGTWNFDGVTSDMELKHIQQKYGVSIDFNQMS